MNDVECYSSEEQWLHDGCHLHEAAEMLVEKAGGNAYEAIKRFCTHAELIHTYGEGELWLELNEITNPLIKMKQYSLKDVVRLTGVPYHRFHYAIRAGQIPEPKQVGRKRYTDKDVAVIKEHFGNKEAK